VLHLFLHWNWKGREGQFTRVVLAADRRSIKADQRDVDHVTARITDEQSRTVPDADHEITFAIQGEGKLIGVDSGDPQSHEDFKSNRRRSFHGLCLAIVQSTRRPGEIQITASSTGLKPHDVKGESTA
jgi:beta-galactosidase